MKRSHFNCRAHFSLRICSKTFLNSNRASFFCWCGVFCVACVLCCLLACVRLAQCSHVPFAQCSFMLCSRSFHALWLLRSVPSCSFLSCLQNQSRHKQRSSLAMLHFHFKIHKQRSSLAITLLLHPVFFKLSYANATNLRLGISCSQLSQPHLHRAHTTVCGQ